MEKKKYFVLKKRRREEYLTGYLFLLPDSVGLFIFWVIPIFYAFGLSFYKWSLLKPKEFIGLSNYIQLFKDELWWKSLKLTGIYTVFFLLGVISLALVLAVFLSSRIKARNWLRTAYFTPYMISLVVTGLVWSYMFETKSGIVNYILKPLGISPHDWIGSTSTALFAVVAVSIWKYYGFYMVLFIAGLQDIPHVYYEMASVDGANVWQRFWHVTFPLLKPVTIFIVIMGLIAGFQSFDLIYVMTNGGPYYATYLVMYNIYEKAFAHLNFGYACAMNTCFFFVLFLLVCLQLKFFSSGTV
jgi:ABC-type sugar transport system permease subunit